MFKKLSAIKIFPKTKLYNAILSQYTMAGEKSDMSNEEKIGYHKGSIQTLVNERNELVRIAQVTESLIKAHLEELRKLGINITDPKETKQ